MTAIELARRLPGGEVPAAVAKVWLITGTAFGYLLGGIAAVGRGYSTPGDQLRMEQIELMMWNIFGRESSLFTEPPVAWLLDYIITVAHISEAAFMSTTFGWFGVKAALLAGCVAILMPILYPAVDTVLSVVPLGGDR